MLLFQLDPALCVGNAGVNLDKEVVIPSCLSLVCWRRMLPFQLDSPFRGQGRGKI